MQLARRMLNIPILHLDTNLINARQGLPSVNQLEQWLKDEVILINWSSTAHQEAQAGGSKDRARKANEQIFTVTEPVSETDPLFMEVADAFFPGGVRDDNQRNDVRIVCEAEKYQAILVTADGASNTQPGGILGNRHKLNGLVQVMSPEEAVAFVRGKIIERDSFNHRFVRAFGSELPSWTGRDNGDG
jgi:hypothetical protein